MATEAETDKTSAPAQRPPEAPDIAQPSDSSADPAARETLDFGALKQVPMTLHVEIGRAVMTLGDILDQLDVGATIRLDRHAGDPVEVYVNGALFARAEVVVVQDQIGVKIIELIDPAQGARPSGLR